MALLNLCGQTWLETHGNVTGEWVAKQLRDHLDDFVLTKDLVMQALIKKHGQFEGVAYSLLVSYGKVGAQPVHIDCVFPEYMATLTLTPGPKTDIFLVNEEMDIELGEMTCQDFARLICNRSGCRSCKEHEEELALALQDEHIPEMIKHYGYVLSSWECRNRASDKLLKSHPGLADNETGYVGMLGSVCHSGPMFNGLRGVLYGSYNIPGRKGYNGRNQYNSATLLAVIISFLVENEDVKLTLGCMEMLLKLLLEVSKEPYQEDFLDKVTLCSEAACLLEMLTETMVTEKVTTEKKMTVKVRVEKKFEPKEVAEVYEWVVAKREIEGEEGQLRSEAVNEGEEVHERSEAVNKYEELLAAKRKAEEEAKREEEAMRKKEEAKRKKEEAKSKKARRSRK